MRHIPDDELHAYLDQALSRSQCIEIERHLAHCAPCRAVRDDAAALRDRTTAMLAHLAPAEIVIPPFETLRRRAGAMPPVRRPRTALWAASVAAALAAGFAGHGLLQGPVTPPELATATVPTPQSPAAQLVQSAPQANRTVAPERTTATPAPRLGTGTVSPRVARRPFEASADDVQPVPARPLSPTPTAPPAVETASRPSATSMRVSVQPLDVGEGTETIGAIATTAGTEVAPTPAREAVTRPRAIPDDSVRALLRRLHYLLRAQ